MADETAATAAALAAAAQRPGYRGKCLYKTGKCTNERALKTSGQAHNLCDEHRHRQNEHQRKLDAKNRFARKDKRATGKDDSPTNARVGGGVHVGQRYVPYGKVRMSPTGAAGTSVEDVHAILGRNGIVATQPMLQFHALGVDGANTMAAASQMVGAANGTAMPSGTPEILPSGVVILPNGPQAPQIPYPSPMQDFDGIVVPLPSYLEGHERVEFRSRIYQKVLDFIAEECMRRFGAVAPTTNGGQVAPPLQPAAASVATDRRDEPVSGGAPMTTTLNIPVGDGKHGNVPASATESEASVNEGKAPSASAENGKDGNDGAQPEDGEDANGDDGDDAPRSKRATRSRAVRKETQNV